MSGWLNRQIDIALANLLARPIERRGPHIITDEELMMVKPQSRWKVSDARERFLAVFRAHLLENAHTMPFREAFARFTKARQKRLHTQVDEEGSGAVFASIIFDNAHGDITNLEKEQA